MIDEEYAAELESLLLVAEDIRDGTRAGPFTHEELVRLCACIERTIALVSDEA